MSLRDRVDDVIGRVSPFEDKYLDTSSSFSIDDASGAFFEYAWHTQIN